MFTENWSAGRGPDMGGNGTWTPGGGLAGWEPRALAAGGLECRPRDGRDVNGRTAMLAREPGGPWLGLSVPWAPHMARSGPDVPPDVDRALGEGRVDALLEALCPWAGHMAWVDRKLSPLLGRFAGGREAVTRAAWETFGPVALDGWEGLCALARLSLDEACDAASPFGFADAPGALDLIDRAQALGPGARAPLEAALSASPAPDRALALAANGAQRGGAVPDAGLAAALLAALPGPSVGQAARAAREACGPAPAARARTP